MDELTLSQANRIIAGALEAARHAQIKSQGYGGRYSRVTDFVRAWRQHEGQAVSSKAVVPLAFKLCEAVQFDWSEEGLVVGGIYDNMKTAVDRVKKGKGRTHNKRFAASQAKVSAALLKHGRRLQQQLVR